MSTKINTHMTEVNLAGDV